MLSIISLCQHSAISELKANIELLKHALCSQRKINGSLQYRNSKCQHTGTRNLTIHILKISCLNQSTINSFLTGLQWKVDEKAFDSQIILAPLTLKGEDKSNLCCFITFPLCKEPIFSNTKWFLCCFQEFASCCMYRLEQN